MNNELYDREEYKVFTDNLHKVSMNHYYNGEQENNVIDYLSSLPTNDALYVLDLLNDFFSTGYDYGLTGGYHAHAQMS